MMILAIDPGPSESAYAVLNEKLKPIKFDKVKNIELLAMLDEYSRMENCELAIEMVASYGMSVGVEVFETVFWIGRFWQEFDAVRTKIYRKDVKTNLCNTIRAKDSNIRQALIDRFGNVGTKKKPGWFYGVSKDIWSAIVVGVTYADTYLKQVS